MSVCSKCGAANEEAFIFCKRCGARLSGIAPEGKDQLGVDAQDPKQAVLDAIDSSRQTDKRISPLWASIALLAIMGTTGWILVLVIFEFLDLAISMNIDFFEWVFVWILFGRAILTGAFGVLFAILTMKLLSRLNKHIEREESLRAGLMAFLRRSAVRSGGEQMMIDELLRLSAFDGQAMVYEKKLSPVAWGFGMFILFFLGSMSGLVPYGIDSDYFNSNVYIVIALILSLFNYVSAIIGFVLVAYLTSYLMRTLVTHEARWDGFANATAIASKKVGLSIKIVKGRPPTPDRSFVLYLVLTVVTLGFFAVYWLYVLIEDPNRHFERQKRFEDNLAHAIRTVS